MEPRFRRLSVASGPAAVDRAPVARRVHGRVGPVSCGSVGVRALAGVPSVFEDVSSFRHACVSCADVRGRVAAVLAFAILVVLLCAQPFGPVAGHPVSRGARCSRRSGRCVRSRSRCRSRRRGSSACGRLLRPAPVGRWVGVRRRALRAFAAGLVREPDWVCRRRLFRRGSAGRRRGAAVPFSRCVAGSYALAAPRLRGRCPCIVSRYRSRASRCSLSMSAYQLVPFGALPAAPPRSPAEDPVRRGDDLAVRRADVQVQLAVD